MMSAAESTRVQAAPRAFGLSASEAAERLGRDGPNALPAGRRVRVWQRVLMQLRDPLVLVLLVAAGLTIATRDWTDAGVILLVIVVNTSVGVVQEVKADQAIGALGELTAPRASVVRDGVACEVPSVEVVVGDLIVLAEGGIVPADARVVEAAQLLVDESALTGESVPVEKTAASVDGVVRGDAEAAPEGSVSAGTVVVRGRGTAVVSATGAESAMGRIAALLGSGPSLTPLQLRLVGVGRALAVAAVALCAVVLALGLARGEEVELTVITAISLVVAAVPESLPAVVTLALALGSRRMAARAALVRRLPAVETLGSVTVLATDKTGTITEGTMAARAAWTPGGGDARIEGAGYAPRGAVRRAGVRLDPVTSPDLAALLSAAALCNDALVRPSDSAEGEWTALGDPTEAALVAGAERFGLDTEELRAANPRVAEIPFDSERRRMTTVHRLPDGRLRVVCKGAPEAVLRPPLTDEPADVIAEALRRAEAYAAEGLRVLAVAQAHAGDGGASDRVFEQGLRLLGLVAVLDPPRASAAATIAACRAAGITPVLITGDHPATARAIAAAVGIIGHDDANAVVDCRGLARARPEVLRSARVFARAKPEQKLEVIEAHRGAGQVVAMTGDGVNDAPALRHAEIGVAMGRRGTEVARQSADLVLADDELSTVVSAVEEGRRVYANIRRFLLYGLAGGSAEIAVMITGPLVGLPLPLLPAQILWINLLTHGLPGVALGSEPAEEGVMGRPPRPPAESVLGAGLWQRILRIGAVISAVTIGVALWGNASGRPWQSMAFFALGATQLAVGLASRSRPGTRANPLLPIAIAGAFCLQLAGIYFAPLRDLLGTSPLSLLELVVVCVLSVFGYVAFKLDGWMVRRRRRPGNAA